MRDLIKPTLFIIARTGLFLAVVAWIVGQSPSKGVIASWLSLSFDETGVCFGVAFKFIGFGIVDFGSTTNGVIEGVYLGPNHWHVNLGVAAIACGPDGVGIALHHWLHTFLLAAFNTFLHIIYRKRPEVQPCEN